MVVLLLMSRPQSSQMLTPLLQEVVSLYADADVSSGLATVQIDASNNEIAFDWQDIVLSSPEMGMQMTVKSVMLKARYRWSLLKPFALHSIALDRPHLTLTPVTQTAQKSAPFHPEKLIASLESFLSIPLAEAVLYDGAVESAAGSIRSITLKYGVANTHSTLNGGGEIVTQDHRVPLLIAGTGTLNQNSLEQFDLTVNSRDVSSLMQGLTQAFLKISLRPAQQQLVLEEFSTKLENVALKANATLHWQAKNATLEGMIAAQNLDITTALRYWPVGLANGAKAWVSENIKQGVVPKGTIAVALEMPEFLPQNLKLKKLQGKAALQNITAQYFAKAPLFQNTQGEILFDDTSITANITQATLNTLPVNKAQVILTNLDTDLPQLKLDATITGLLARQMELALPFPAVKRNITTNTRTEVFGTGTTVVKVGFPLQNEIRNEDINFDIQGKFTDVSLPLPRVNVPATESAATLTINNDTAKMAVKGKLVGLPAVWEWTGYLKEAATTAETAVVTFTPNFTDLQDLGGAAFGAGDFTAQLTYKRPAKGDGTVDVLADFTAAKLTPPVIAWEKPAGSKATLAMRLPVKNYSVNSITDLQFKVGDVLAVQGNAMLAASGKVADGYSIVLKKFALGETIFTGAIQKNRDSASITAAVPSLRLQSLSGGGKEGSKGSEDDTVLFQWSTQVPVNVALTFGKITVGAQTTPLLNTSITATLRDKKITTASITGSVKGRQGDTPFSMTIDKARGGLRAFNASTDNMGELLQALDVYSNMRNGVLRVTGSLNERSQLDSKIKITDFSVVRAPILAKILNVASITAPLQLLQNKGIVFNKTLINMRKQGDSITLTDGRLAGESIGLTVEGSINMADNTLDLSGTVLPFYMINNIFANIPLLGDLLTNNKKEGLIALRYSVRGDQEDPDVMVNPLSVLTPGFLRQFFDVF